MAQPTRSRSYQYRPLGANEVRIFTLVAGLREDQIKIRLRTHNINETPQYHAISYCWGDARVPEQCLCEDDGSISSFHLTDNLCEALRVFRRVDRDIALWADQICINQGDFDEKAHSVRLMGRIYYNAAGTMVWLGMSDASTSEAFRVVYETYDQVQQVKQDLALSDNYTGTYPLTISPEGASEWTALRKLLRRSWFNRLWVLQEVVLSRKSLIVCGEHNVPMDKLWTVCAAVRALDSEQGGTKTHLDRTDDEFQYMVMCHVATRETDDYDFCRPYLNLLNLMKHARNLKSTIPADKVYGIVGLANDIDIHDIPIDYSKPAREVFARVTRCIIQSKGDLSALDLVDAGWPRSRGQRDKVLGPPSLPSWVPDFRYGYGGYRNVRLSMGPMLSYHGNSRVYRATGLSRAEITNDNTLQLILRGVLVGSITEVSDPDGNGTEGMAINPKVLVGREWSHFAHQVATDGIYSPTGETIELAYWRLRLLDVLPHEKNPQDRKRRVEPVMHTPEPQQIQLDSDGYPETCNDLALRVFMNTVRKRLFITNSGYLGMAHESCLQGDLVYLLMGGETPYILRSLGNGTYQFQGYAYVHGIMDGEFLLQKFKCQTARFCHIGDSEWLDTLGQEPIPFPTQTLTLS